MKPRLPYDIEFLLESILTENPDSVKVGDDAYSFHRHDARPFMIFEKFAVIANYQDAVHNDILDMLQGAQGSEDTGKYLRGATAYKITDIEGAIEELNDSGELDQFISKGDWLDDASPRENVAINGRVWLEARILSFWNSKEKVFDGAAKVEKMFIDLKDILGDIEEYRIDFIERRDRKDVPLTPGKALSSKNGGAAANKDALPTLSKEQLKALQQKIHTMPPEKKQKMLRLMGAGNAKAGQIAAKLGMTVAQFNHLMQVNEQRLPGLMELATEIHNKRS